MFYINYDVSVLIRGLFDKNRGKDKELNKLLLTKVCDKDRNVNL